MLLPSKAWASAVSQHGSLRYFLTTVLATLGDATVALGIVCQATLLWRWTANSDRPGYCCRGQGWSSGVSCHNRTGVGCLCMGIG